MTLQMYFILRVVCKITQEINRTLSPVEVFDLPSASLTDNEPVPTDGSTASASSALLMTDFFLLVQISLLLKQKLR
jgi:hypothetical protein